MQKENKQLHFILIDDNEIDLFFHEKLLQIQGVATETSSFLSAAEALDFLSAYKDNPDLYPPTIILLDIQMPEIDGFDFLDHIEKMPEPILKNTRIFIVSSSLDYSDLSRSYAHHLIDNFLKKPLDTKELKQALKEAGF